MKQTNWFPYTNPSDKVDVMTKETYRNFAFYRHSFKNA